MITISKIREKVDDLKELENSFSESNINNIYDDHLYEMEKWLKDYDIAVGILDDTNDYITTHRPKNLDGVVELPGPSPNVSGGLMIEPNTIDNYNLIMKNGTNIKTGLRFAGIAGDALMWGVDYNIQVSEGEDNFDAAAKSTLHTGVGFGTAAIGAAAGGAASGAVVGSVVPVAGTIAGAVIGAVVGIAVEVIISPYIEKAVDSVYDYIDETFFDG